MANVTSNGWPWKDTGLSAFTAPNGHVTSVANRSLAIVFAYLAYRWDTEIEPVTACYGNRTVAEQKRTNPNVMDSNHISATAIDVNGGKHPYELTTRSWSTGFTTAQEKTLRGIIADTGILQTGLDFASPYRDGMHVQVRQNVRGRQGVRLVSQADTDAAANRIGAWVARVQKTVGVTADQLMGPGTKRAILAWQRSKKLTPDGIFGPACEKAAGWVTSTAFPLPAGHWYGVNDGTAYSHSGIRGGADATNVGRIQATVGSPADHIYGPATAAKVAAWQKAHKLAADSKVGPATWKALGL